MNALLYDPNTILHNKLSIQEEQKAKKQIDNEFEEDIEWKPEFKIEGKNTDDLNKEAKVEEKKDAEIANWDDINLKASKVDLPSSVAVSEAKKEAPKDGKSADGITFGRYKPVFSGTTAKGGKKGTIYTAEEFPDIGGVVTAKVEDKSSDNQGRKQEAQNRFESLKEQEEVPKDANKGRKEYKPREDRNDFRNKDDKGDYKPREDRNDFRNKEGRGDYKPREDRGDYKPREDRNDFRNKDDKGDYKPREDRNDFRNKDDKGEFKPREDRPYRKDKEDEFFGNFRESNKGIKTNEPEAKAEVKESIKSSEDKPAGGAGGPPVFFTNTKKNAHTMAKAAEEALKTKSEEVKPEEPKKKYEDKPKKNFENRNKEFKGKDDKFERKDKGKVEAKPKPAEKVVKEEKPKEKKPAPALEKADLSKNEWGNGNLEDIIPTKE